MKPVPDAAAGLATLWRRPNMTPLFFERGAPVTVKLTVRVMVSPIGICAGVATGVK
jgi:hypothetical protein